MIDLDKINLSTEVIPARAISTTPLKFINTFEDFREMIEVLRSHDEIAVDLEHSDKSYYGITCLMQLSTRM
jgi:hypothetical protein